MQTATIEPHVPNPQETKKLIEKILDYQKKYLGERGTSLYHRAAQRFFALRRNFDMERARVMKKAERISVLQPWMAQLPDKLKFDRRLSRFKSIGELAEAYLKMIGR